MLNAYDDGDQVVMDVVRYDRAFDTEPGEPIATGLPALARWRIDPLADKVVEQRLDDLPVEFPRIDDAVAGRPHRYGYCAQLADDPEHPDMTALIKYDLVRDQSTRFDPGPHRSAGEPVFVRAADGRGEDEGWILTVVYDAEPRRQRPGRPGRHLVRRATGGHRPPARPGALRVSRVVGAGQLS